MAHDTLRNSGLVRALTDLLADLSDLVQKEFRLARAEVTEKISARLQASGWMVAAGLLGLIAALLIVEATALAIASYGLALHWACLLVAAILAAAGAAVFYHGRSLADEELLPTRSVRQVTRDIATAKEQLT
jgi:Putative Actinobacterial Holin-X, holin superfamily III